MRLFPCLVLVFWSATVWAQRMPFVQGTTKMIYIADTLLNHNPTKSIQIYEQALSRVINTNDQLTQATCYSKLGYALFLTGDYYSSLLYQKKALFIFENLELDSLVAHQLSQIGSLYYFSDVTEVEKALKYFRESYEQFNRLQFEEQATLNLNYSGYIYWAKGEKEKALRVHLKALSLFKSQFDSLGIATSTSDVGFTLNSLNRYQQAIPYHFEALRLEQRLNQPLMQVPTLNNIAISYKGLGNYKMALRYSLKSLQMAQERSMLLRQSEAWKTLADIYHLLNDYKQAFESLSTHKMLNDSLKSIKQAKKMLSFEMQKDFESKEQKMKLQTEQEKALAQTEKERDKLIILGLSVVSIAILILLAVIGKNVRIKNKYNKQLIVKQEELAKSQQALLKANEQLEKRIQERTVDLSDALEKLTSTYNELDTFLYRSSHDLEGPLASILGLILLGKMRTHDPESLVLFNHIESTSNNMRRMLGKLTAINRIHHSHVGFELIDLDLLIQNIIKKMKMPFNNYEIKNLTDRSIFFYGNYNLVEIILTNLIENGIIFNTNECPLVEVKLTERDLYYHLSVRDNGDGISLSIRDKVYNLFYRGSPKSKGNGLGLFLVKRAVQKLKGKIELHTMEFQYTEFIVVLPTHAHSSEQRNLSLSLLKEKLSRHATDMVRQI